MIKPGAPVPLGLRHVGPLSAPPCMRIARRHAGRVLGGQQVRRRPRGELRDSHWHSALSVVSQPRGVGRWLRDEHGCLCLRVLRGDRPLPPAHHAGPVQGRKRVRHRRRRAGACCGVPRRAGPGLWPAHDRPLRAGSRRPPRTRGLCCRELPGGRAGRCAHAGERRCGGGPGQRVARGHQRDRVELPSRRCRRSRLPAVCQIL
jgi:hypothetical protein